MDKNQTVAVLNAFININNKHAKKYEFAFFETNDLDLKNLFLSFIEKVKKNNEVLIFEIEKLGGKPVKETARNTSRFLKFWMSFASKFTIKDREDILNCCEYDEEVFIKNYRNFFKDNVEHLTLRHQEILKFQLQKIKSNHDILKSLGDRFLVQSKNVTNTYFQKLH